MPKERKVYSHHCLYCRITLRPCGRHEDDDPTVTDAEQKLARRADRY